MVFIMGGSQDFIGDDIMKRTLSLALALALLLSLFGGLRLPAKAANASYNKGKREEVYKECIALFKKMAETTGTLWEHNSTGASCIHGFAAYAARWLVYALTGYDIVTGKQDGENGIGIDCEISIPLTPDRYLNLTVKNNKLTK